MYISCRPYTGVIEDEQHITCNCTLYDTFQINLFGDPEKCMLGFLLRGLRGR